MSKKNLDQLLDTERDQRSMELFRKPFIQLEIAEREKLDRYLHDLQHPEWRPIQFNEYNTNYEISNIGTVRNVKKRTYLKPGLTGRYLTVVMSAYHGGVYWHTSPLVHRLVALAFIPNPGNKPEVNHINGVKTCNWVGNLEWVTREENMQHAIKTGLMKVPGKGIEGRNCKHTEEQVHQVCQLLEQKTPIKEIAEKLGVTAAFVKGVKQKNWADIRAQYNIPDPNPHAQREGLQQDIIDDLVAIGVRDRALLIACAGMLYNKTSISYVKWRIRVYNENQKAKGSTTISATTPLEERPWQSSAGYPSKPMGGRQA